MKPSKFIINSPSSLSLAIGKLKGLWNKHKYLRVTVAAGIDRTSQQNRLLHAWFSEIAECRSEYTPEDVKSECKLRYFVPILRAENEQFADAYDAAIKPLDYETKLKAISLMPVTSICTTSQLNRGMEQMQSAYANMGSDAVFLEFPEE